MNTSIQQTSRFLIILDQVRNLKIDWAINLIVDYRVVLRFVNLWQLIWNLAVDPDMFMKYIEETVVIGKEYKTVYWLFTQLLHSGVCS